MQTQTHLFPVLLWCNGFSNVGYFATYALLAVYFLNVVQFPNVTISILLLFAAVAMRTSRIICAPLIDLLGLRYAMVLSMLFCAVGYLSLAFFHSIPMMFFALLIIGIGYGTNSLIIRALTSFLNNGSTLYRYAALNMIANIAAAFGPMIGNFLLIKFPQYGLGFFSASVFLIAAFISLFIEIKSSQDSKQQWIGTIIAQLRLAKVRFCLILSALVWFLLAQFYSLLPLYLSKGLGATHLLGSIYLMNALVIIVFSIPVNKWLVRKNLGLSWQSLCYFTLFFLGCFMLLLWQNLLAVYIAVILWSFAEVIMTPAINTLVVNITQQQVRLIGFAINAIAIGIGEGLGNFAGILLAGYDWKIAFISLGAFALFCLFLILANFHRNEFLLAQGGKP